jgi:1,4-dihydroxy-2-naphthoate polyprenyltransferase
LFLKNTSLLKAWISAARIRTLPLSVSGILIGSSYAYFSEKFRFSVFFIAILTTISYQLLSNFANDYGDGVKGTDDNRVGPKRTVQTGLISRVLMKKGIIVLSLTSSFLTLALIVLAFGLNSFYVLIFAALGGLAIFSAIKYTVGKFAYGYFGLGDLFVFLFFGLISVLGSNFLFGSVLEFKLLSPSIVLGLLSVGVLNLNNMRDIQNDADCGKKTLAVVLGAQKAKFYHLFIISFALVLISHFQYELNISSNYLNFFLIINSLGLFVHLFKVNNVSNPKEYDKYLKVLALHAFLFSVLISFYFFKILV